jgi:tetratricopeptide (TPR) repeat protein
MVGETLDHAQKMGAPRAIALCRNFGGFLAFHAGRWDEAEASLREALAAYQILDSGSGASSSLQRLGVLMNAQGRLDEAMEVFRQSLDAAEGAVMRSHCLARSYASMAANRLAAGDLEAADRYIQEGRDEAERHGNCLTCSALLLPESVRVQLAHARFPDALVDVERLEQIAAEYGSKAWTAMAKQARGRYLLATGDLEGAGPALLGAEEAYAAYGHIYEAARCQALRARVAADQDEARALDEAARRTMTALGSRWPTSQLANLL